MYSLLYQKIVSLTSNLFGSLYYVMIVLLVFLLVNLLWKYWKTVKLYEKFPTYPLLVVLTFSIIFKKIPSHLPLNAFLFQSIVHLARKFQDEGLVLIWVPKPTLFIFIEEAVKIFSNDKAAINKPYHYDVIKECIGNGLLTSYGETWKKHRKMLNPAFQVGALKSTVSIFNENAENLVKELEETTNEASVDILKYIKFYTLCIVCEYTLGIKVNNEEGRDSLDKIFEAVDVIESSLVQRFCLPWQHFKFVMDFFPSGRKSKKMFNYCHNFMKQMILKTKESADFSEIAERNGEWESEESGQNLKSFVHILLKHHLEDPDFTMEDVQDEVTAILTAGHDTISYGLMWSLFLLGQHPDVQEQAFEEINSTLEEFIQYDDLHKLKYLECIIKESLRIYPSIPIYARCTDKDIQCGKYKVPEGTDVVFFPYVLHRNRDVFPDPEKFDPDRFRDGKLENRPWAYTPFAEGIRSCFGKRFAMMEMKVVLAYILRNFQITSVTLKEEVKLSWAIALAPTRPLLFKLTPRKRILFLKA